MKTLSDPIYLQTVSGIKDDLASGDACDQDIMVIDDMDFDTETKATQSTSGNA